MIASAPPVSSLMYYSGRAFVDYLPVPYVLLVIGVLSLSHSWLFGFWIVHSEFLGHGMPTEPLPSA